MRPIGYSEKLMSTDLRCVNIEKERRARLHCDAYPLRKKTKKKFIHDSWRSEKFGTWQIPYKNLLPHQPDAYDDQYLLSCDTVNSGNYLPSLRTGHCDGN